MCLMCAWYRGWRGDRNGCRNLAKQLEQWSFHPLRRERHRRDRLGERYLKFSLTLAHFEMYVTPSRDVG